MTRVGATGAVEETRQFLQQLRAESNNLAEL
jgi:hypothetical protein